MILYISDMAQSRSFLKVCSQALCICLTFVRTAEAQENPSRLSRDDQFSKPLHETTLGFGLFNESLLHRTEKRFRAAQVGFAASYEQLVRSELRGGLLLRTNQWESIQIPAEDNLKFEKYVSNIQLFSTLEYAPKLSFLGSDFVTKYIRPFGNMALGYTFFLKERELRPKLSEDEKSEASVLYGIGLRIPLSQHLGIRMSLNRWRGLATFRYAALTHELAIVIGDVQQ